MMPVVNPYKGAKALTTQAILNNQNALRVFSRIELDSIQKLKIISRVLGIALHLNMLAMALIPVLFPTYWWVMLVGGLGGGLILQIPRSRVNNRILEKQKTHAALKVSLALLSQDPSKKEYFPKGLGDLKAVDPRLRSDLRFEDQREKERPARVSSIKARVDHLDLAITPANARTFALESAALKAGLNEPFSLKEFQKQVVAARAFLDAGDHAGYEKEIQRIQKAALVSRSVFASVVCQPKKADESVRGCFSQADALLKDIGLAPRCKMYQKDIEIYKEGRQLFRQVFDELAKKKEPKAKKEREAKLIALKKFIVKLTAFKEKVVSNTTNVSFENARAAFTNFMGRFEAFAKLIHEAKGLINRMPFLGDDQTFKSFKSEIKKFEEDKIKIETFILDLEKNGNLNRVGKVHLNGYIALLDLRLAKLHQKLNQWLEGNFERFFKSIDSMFKEVDQIDVSKKTPEFKKSRRAFQKKIDAFKIAFTKVRNEKDYQTQLKALEKFEKEVESFKKQFTIITRKEFWKASYKAVFAPPQPVQRFTHEKPFKHRFMIENLREKRADRRLPFVVKASDVLEIDSKIAAIKTELTAQKSIVKFKLAATIIMLQMEKAKREAVQRLPFVAKTPDVLKIESGIAAIKTRLTAQKPLKAIVRFKLAARIIMLQKEKTRVEAAHIQRIAPKLNLQAAKNRMKNVRKVVIGKVSPFSKTQTTIDKLLRAADKSFMRRHIAYRVFDLVAAIVMAVAIGLFYENPWLFMGLASLSVLRSVGHEIIGYALSKANNRVKELKMKDAFRGKLAPFRPKGFSEAQLEAHKTTPQLAKRCRLAVQKLEGKLKGIKNKAQREETLKEVRFQIKEVRSHYAEIARKNFVSPTLV